MTAGKKFLKDLNSQLRERWNETTEPVRVLWRDMKSIADPLIPNFKGARKYYRNIRDARRLLRLFDSLGEDYSEIVGGFHRSKYVIGLVYLTLRVEENIPDIEPVMARLFDRGWEVSRQEDERRAREYKLKHPDSNVTLYISARIGDNSKCEIREHKRTETQEVVEHEIICEGEAELTGRV